MKKGNSAPFDGVLTKDFVFREYVEAKQLNSSLEEKIQTLEFENIKCQDRPTVVNEVSTMFLAGSVGAVVGAVLMALALSH